MTRSRFCLLPGLLLFILSLVGLPTMAQQPAPAGGDRVQTQRLPVDNTTEHSVELPGRTLKVLATAGSLPLADPAGSVQAEVGYVYYRLADGDPATRPVTFAVNGGPGASSAYLHLLVAGPWRLPLDGPSISPSAPPVLVPNAETWLDFTDLVFLDPVGTGYSRANGQESEIRDRYYSVDGDVSSLSAVISRFLRQSDRLVAPKFFLGESYGGFRGPLLARRLQTDLGIGFSGLTLLSPVLDFGWLSEPAYKPMEAVIRLPSLAASALERRAAADRPATVKRDDLRAAEAYAEGPYLADLLRGPADREAVARMTERVAALTGLDPALVRQRGGRIDAGTYQREVGRAEGRVLSAYDTGVSGWDPTPNAASPDFDDPVLTAMTAPLTSAAVDLLWRRLKWPVRNQRYELLAGGISGAWRFGRGRRPAEAMSDLGHALALDGRMRVLVAHGLTDLVTPYFASALLLRQLPALGDAGRVSLTTYPGGHMFYTREASRTAFRDDARRMYDAALADRRQQ